MDKMGIYYRDFDVMAAVTSAVYVKDAYKHYGPKTGPKRKQVLDGLCMKVHRGSIYGLLGASGCGKTTLLSCIVGRKLFDSGELWVLGGTPGTEGSGVPGPRIGYMPQETALIPEFTVRGIVFYFGRIFGMADKDISARFEELKTLLDLPPDNKMVGNCSGGQQRRVSFAASLIHDPELLILDEPTVGLDPVLRERIWEYLVEITVKKNIAVIITTHYIEECRQAHKIGLMRQGRLLAEETPENLIRDFQAETLEEVFLELSKRQAEGVLPAQNANREYDRLAIEANQSVASSAVSLEGGGSKDLLTDNLKRERKKTSSWVITGDRFKALYLKNWLTFFRNTSGVAFALLFPLVQMLAFFLAVGADPKQLPLGFVNDENGTCEGFDIKNTVYYNEDSECEFRYLSCRFMHDVEDPMIRKIMYYDLDTAINAVHKGKVIGVVYFPRNYTESARLRALDGRDAPEEALEFGEIKVWLDMSNHQIGPVLQKKLLRKYVDFQKRMLSDCKYDPEVGEIPLRINDPIYGSEDDSYTVFVAPGFMVTVIFFMATMMTATVFISERLGGVWDRTLVAGATTAEILVSHVVTQFFITAFQVAEVMLISFVAYQIDVIGKFYDVIGILITMGMSGMCYGFLISVVCESHTQANFIATGSFYPMLIISGVMWPVEAMPLVLKIFSKVLPFTYPIEALRAVIKKGWMITNALLIDAYAVSIGWNVIFLLLSFYFLKSKM